MWQTVLVLALVANAMLGLGYRVYRRTKGGPVADVWGQAVLGVFLLALAAGIAADITWLRWAAVAYAASFALLVMPVWVLGVLLPLPPRGIDYGFTVAYWMLLLLIVVAAIAN